MALVHRCGPRPREEDPSLPQRRCANDADTKEGEEEKGGQIVRLPRRKRESRLGLTDPTPTLDATLDAGVDRGWLYFTSHRSLNRAEQPRVDLLSAPTRCIAS
jgi:hypothetical protein